MLPLWSCIYAAAVSQLRLGILTEEGEGSKAASLSSGPEGRRSAEQALRVPHVCPEP